MKWSREKAADFTLISALVNICPAEILFSLKRLVFRLKTVGFKWPRVFCMKNQGSLRPLQNTQHAKHAIQMFLCSHLQANWSVCAVQFVCRCRWKQIGISFLISVLWMSLWLFSLEWKDLCLRVFHSYDFLFVYFSASKGKRNEEFNEAGKETSQE